MSARVPPDPGLRPPRSHLPESGNGRAGLARVSAGRVLYSGGALVFPVGVGLWAGYWLADADVRWSSVLASLLGGWIVAFSLMAGGLWLIGSGTGREVGRKRMLALSILIVMGVGLVFGIQTTRRPVALTQLHDARFTESFRTDAQLEREHAARLVEVVSMFTSRPSLFQPGALPTPEDETFLLDAWQSFLDTAIALDQIRRFYEDYYHFDLGRAERARHVQSFLLTFASELALYESGRAIVRVISANPNAVKFLDAPREARGISAGSYTWLSRELVGAADLSRVEAGARYLAYLDAVHGARAHMSALGDGASWDRVEQRLEALGQTSALSRGALAAGREIAPLTHRAGALKYPVQAGVAEWLGDTRVRRAGRYLIGPELQAELRKAMKPGDILLARKNWYLSNVGLPGFWPHAALYLGDIEELSLAFDADPEVLAYVASLAGRDLKFTDYLADRFPEAWLEKRASERARHSKSIVEAISEGVSQSELSHVAGDYAAVLRPKGPAVWKARAIVRALEYLGRPYDFEFDFATDHAVVCTELVWRSYRPDASGQGLELPVIQLLGRTTMPANELARWVRDGAGGAELVMFVEGIEASQTARVASAEEFFATPSRSKWDFGQP